MRAVIFGYFGTLTDPGAEEYREPLAHRTGELRVVERGSAPFCSHPPQRTRCRRQRVRRPGSARKKLAPHAPTAGWHSCPARLKRAAGEVPAFLPARSDINLWTAVGRKA